MKIAILGDLHAGEADGNRTVLEHQLKWLCESFVPYLKDNGVDTVIQTGDIFDVRRNTNNLVLHLWRARFFDLLSANGIDVHAIVGNHDTYYKDTLTPNTVDEFLGHYRNVTVYNEPMVVDISSGANFLMVPWICQENYDSCIESIGTSDAKYCIGHFEIKGARMESGVCTEGMPLETFGSFQRCLSGHFHTVGQYNNVTYVGTPYQLTWGDYGVAKGFHILDTDTDELTFVGNDEQLFIKIHYNEEKDMSVLISDGLCGKFVKVIIECREDFKAYEKWLMKLESIGCQDIKIIEPYMSRSVDESDVDVSGDLDVESTEDIITEFVSDVYPEKADKLNKMMLGLYAEARKLCE